MKKINEQLIKLRDAKKMTQLDLALQTGCKPATICTYETQGREPRVSLARRIAKTLGTTIDDLWPDESESSQTNCILANVAGKSRKR